MPSSSPRRVLIDNQYFTQGKESHKAMNEFITLITTFPVIVPTFLLCVVLLYWLLVLIGAMDLDIFEVDIDLDVEGGGEGLSGFLVNWGLTGVPISIVISLMVSTVWLLTTISSSLLLPLLPLEALRWLVGLIILLVLFALTIPLTAQMIRPMRGMFRAHQAVNKSSLIGSECVVKTLSVTPTFGQGELTDGEAGLLLDIIANEPNDIGKGDTVLLLEYDENRDCYLVGKP